MRSKTMLVLLLAAYLIQQAACASSGTSVVTISNSSIHLTVGRYSGTVMIINCSVALQNGTSGRTVLISPNQKDLLAEGITVNASPISFSDAPPFQCRIIIAANPSAKPGNYSIQFATIGADPSINNATVNVFVSPSQSTTTQQIPAGTASGPQQIGQQPDYVTQLFVTIAAIIVIIALYVTIMNRRKRNFDAFQIEQS